MKCVSLTLKRTISSIMSMAIGMITKEMMESDDFIGMNIVASQTPRKEDMLDGDTLL